MGNKKNKIIFGLIAVILVILIILLRSCGSGVDNVQTPDVQEPIGNFEVGGKQEGPTVEKVDEDIPTITFSGYGKYTVSNSHPNVELSNPDVNFVDMVFTLTDKESGTIIARTNKVSAGDYVYVNVMDFYKQAGTYTILIDTSTYDADSGEQMNGMHQEMEVTVENK